LCQRRDLSGLQVFDLPVAGAAAIVALSQRSIGALSVGL
jgi:hypothetical protein